MGISIQSANNLLRTLYRRGYVSQDCKRNYRLGARCIYLGSYADRWGALRARLAAPVKQLVAETGYVAFAGVIENDRMLCIIMQDPSQTEPYIPQIASVSSQRAASWNRLRREEKVGMLRRAAELAAQ